MRNTLGWLLTSCVFVGAIGLVSVGCGGGEGAQPAAFEVASSEAEVGQASVLLDVPYIGQNPELPRGCEVTSLAMMLNYVGVSADKMTLASKIEKVPFWVSDGV